MESCFKYLGSGMEQDCSMQKEVEIRRARALGMFESFNRVWENNKLCVAHKMAVYNAFIVPHFLYGSEAWNCTASQLHMLETAHSACLRHIMGVDKYAHHSMSHIYEVCHSQPITLTVIQNVFRWLGHVLRMSKERYPRMAYGCLPVGGARPRGRPKGTYRHTYRWMLEQVRIHEARVSVDDFLDNMEVCAQDRVAWYRLVKGMSLKQRGIPTPPTRRSERLLNKNHAIGSVD